MGKPHARRVREGRALLTFVLTFALIGLPFLLLLIVLIWRQPAPPPTPWPTAVLTVRLPNVPSPTSSAPAPTPTSTRPAEEAAIRVGLRVAVSGTGTGLNLRGAPSVAAPAEYLAQDGDTFLVLQGPIENDAFRWWRLQKADAPDVVGWAVERYLRPLP